MTEPKLDSPQVRRFCPMCEIQVVSTENQCPNCSGPLMVGDPEDLTGKVIDGRYTVVQRLGKGGMGVVYRARQRFLDRDVALKVLRPEFAMDTMAVRRFLQEAKAASGLKNPHTVTIFEFGSTAEGTLYFTMELLSGRSLREVIEQEGPLPAERVLGIGAQVCESLAEAHEQGIWHRDLKPDNIYLIDSPQHRDYVKVLDFGIAKVSTQQTQLTSTGAICGTPQYMSPEQAKGIALDGRSDVYSLGVVLYEALCGCAPFDAVTPIQMLMAHITQPAPFPRERRPGLQVPPSVEEVVMWALGKEPEHRPESAKAYAAALRTAASHPLATHVRPVTPPAVQAQPVVLDTLAGTALPPTASMSSPASDLAPHPEAGQRHPPPPSTRSQKADALAATAFRTEASLIQDEEPPMEYGRSWWRWGIVGVAAMAIATVALVWRPWESTPSGPLPAESGREETAVPGADAKPPAQGPQGSSAGTTDSNVPDRIDAGSNRDEAAIDAGPIVPGVRDVEKQAVMPEAKNPEPAGSRTGGLPGEGTAPSQGAGSTSLGLPKPGTVEINVPSTKPAEGGSAAPGSALSGSSKVVPAGARAEEKTDAAAMGDSTKGTKGHKGTKGTDLKGQEKKGTKGAETPKGTGEKQEKTPPKGDDDDFVPVRGPANGGTGDDDFVPVKK